MKRVNYLNDILKPIAYELGIDPEIDLNNDHAAAWTGFINRYVRQGWEAWNFPELDITEERAFRTIWNSSKQFLRIGTNGQPDELFYIPSLIAGLNPYYVVLKTAPSDPSVGTLPTNTTYFQSLTPVDKYISYDQDCRRSIGRVFNVYPFNPRLHGWNGKNRISWHPSEKGLDVHYTGYTVFVRFQIPPSVFTSKQYSSTTTYNKGDIAYDTTTGDVYRALVTTTNNPPGSSSWMVVPMPYTLQLYAIYAAASCASEDVYQQQQLMAKAEQALGREVDKLIEQGQRLPTYRLGFHRYRHRSEWAEQTCSTTSTPVTTLTDVCQDPWGNVSAQQIVSSIQAGVTAIPQGQDYVDLTFSTAITDSAGNPTGNWEPLELFVEYPTDPPPEKITPWTIVAKTSVGGRIYLNSAPTDGNFNLRWKVAGSGVVTV